MKPAHKELDVVQLKQDIPDEGLASGALGTVLEVFKGGEAYLVEFANGNGETIAMPTLKGDQISPLKRTPATA